MTSGSVRRRSRRGRFLFIAFFKACVLVGLPVGLAAWVMASPVFLVRELEIEMVTDGRVDRRWTEERLGPLFGRPLLGVGLEEVQAALAGNRWIAGVELTKSVPDRLLVRVVEKTPRALWRQGEDLFCVDGDGEIIDLYTPEVGIGTLLILDWPGDTPVPVARTQELLEELSACRPGWSEGAFAVGILAGGDFRLYTEALPYPVLLTAGEVRSGAARLELAMKEIRRLGVRVTEVDVRFSRRVIVQPGAPAGAPMGM